MPSIKCWPATTVSTRWTGEPSSLRPTRVSADGPSGRCPQRAHGKLLHACGAAIGPPPQPLQLDSLPGDLTPLRFNTSFSLSSIASPRLFPRPSSARSDAPPFLLRHFRHLHPVISLPAQGGTSPQSTEAQALLSEVPAPWNPHVNSHFDVGILKRTQPSRRQSALQSSTLVEQIATRTGFDIAANKARRGRTWRNQKDAFQDLDNAENKQVYQNGRVSLRSTRRYTNMETST